MIFHDFSSSTADRSTSWDGAAVAAALRSLAAQFGREAAARDAPGAGE
jgi:hypothetical protein